MRASWYKLRHWEFWPVYVIYFTTSLRWILWAIRLKSLYFYRYVNPAIKNGGLYGDSKYAVYKMLPSHLIPKTIQIPYGSNPNFSALLQNSELTFPLIVKPDIGMRGKHVQIVYSIAEIVNYEKQIKQDYLIQEFCDYPEEMGLFYCRFPHEKEGFITGITLKCFLTVTGDGTSSLADLLLKSDRYRLYISQLTKIMNLHTIPAHGEVVNLVPFGNHNRGTQFLDGSYLISEKLTHTFNKLLGNLEGFHYGRLDIKYHSLTDLEEGRKFKIIEVNGAKSEPTHIYDPDHSFWFGQREIRKHQHYLLSICQMNMLATSYLEC